jgi:HAE1 family hydrophobic/amphiphilic exporter-1
MWLTRTSILRPVTITMVVVAILVLGFVSLGKLPVDLYPKMDIPWVTVVAVYPGTSPQEIETLITKPLEDAVSTISGVKNVQSTSSEGSCWVGIEFEMGTDLNNATNDVREKVDAAGFELPRDMDPPVIQKFDLTAEPVVTFALASPRPPRELRHIADEVVKDRIGKLKGVGSVSISGGDVREIAVAVDKNALEGYGLTINDVVQALQLSNLNLPSGSVKEGKREYAVRAVGEFATPDEIRGVRITTRTGRVVFLSDIAAVADTVAERWNYARVDSRDSITVAVRKQSDANTVQVADAVRAELTALTGQVFGTNGKEVKYGTRVPGLAGVLRKEVYKRGSGSLPPDITARVTMDQSDFIREALADLRTSLLLGALFAVLVVFLFLHNLRGTFIVALAIPTSIIAAFTPMLFAGFSLNQMSMLALSLSVGILVDDSIVVIENIYRHLRMGEKPRDAAFNGRTEIGLAAITITLVDVVVFVPIAFMGGIVGQFFRQFGLTVAIATLFSLFVSFTLTPMLSSRWFREAEAVPVDEEESALPVPALEMKETQDERRRGLLGGPFAAFDRGYGRLREFYRDLLAWALDHRLATVLIGVTALVGATAIGKPWPAHIPSLGSVPMKTVIGIVLASKAMPLMIVAALTGFGLLFAGRGGRLPVLWVGAAAILIAGTFTKQMGFEMFPRVDQGRFRVVVELPAGSSLQATDGIVRRLEAHLLDHNRYPEIDAVNSTVGSDGAATASIGVSLVDKRKRTRSDQDLVSAVDAFARTIPGATIKTTSYEGMGGGGQAPIHIELTGENMQELTTVAERIKAKVAKVPGTLNVDTTWKVGKPEIRATIDRNRAADRGVTTAQVASALRTSLEGDTTSKYREGTTQYDIRVRLNESDRRSVDQVQNLVVGYQNGPVYLGDIADVSMATGPTKIDRKNRQRMVAVESDIAPGITQGVMEKEIQKAIANVPKGNVQVYFGGESEVRRESFGSTNSALGLSVVLIYILMAALFEGYLSPLIIMFALPMALVGALLAITITGKSLSIITMVGIIMLMGLVGKNAILLVDYTNTLRSRGLERRQALLEAGPTRLRPIMMTTMAMICGMLPIVLIKARGGEIRAPMAIAVIGGLLVSTMLTLLVIPVLYTVFDGIGTRFTGLVRRVLSRV